jgi:hypothetical protein
MLSHYEMFEVIQKVIKKKFVLNELSLLVTDYGDFSGVYDNQVKLWLFLKEMALESWIENYQDYDEPDNIDKMEYEVENYMLNYLLIPFHNDFEINGNFRWAVADDNTLPEERLTLSNYKTKFSYNQI